MFVRVEVGRVGDDPVSAPVCTHVPCVKGPRAKVFRLELLQMDDPLGRGLGLYVLADSALFMLGTAEGEIG